MATLGVVPFSSAMTSSGNGDAFPERREILILRKKPKIETELVHNEVTGAATTVLVSSKRKKPSVGSGHRTQQPPPVSVARRNARERNRVKQVNNGFATLRQHIPISILASHSSSGEPSRSNKKLSKVETLRLAVDYIRSLQQLLSMDDNQVSPNSNSPNPSDTSSPRSPGKSLQHSYDDMHTEIPDDDDDDTSLLEAPSPAHYRNAGSFIQLVNATPDANSFIPLTSSFPTEGQLQPLITGYHQSSADDVVILSSGATASLSPVKQFATATLTPVRQFAKASFSPVRQFGTASLSPGVYSEQSLSPDTCNVEEIAFLPAAQPHFTTEEDVMVWWEQDQRIRLPETATSTAS